MKKLFTLLLALMSISLVFGQKTNVPAEVKTAFQKKFPEAKNAEWEFDKEENLWEVEYKINKVEYSTEFNKNGEWLETEKEIKFDVLPEAIKTTLKTDYADYEVEELEAIETPEGDFYEVEIELEKNKKEIEIELTFSVDGKILKKEQQEGEDNDD